MWKDIPASNEIQKTLHSNANSGKHFEPEVRMSKKTLCFLPWERNIVSPNVYFMFIIYFMFYQDMAQQRLAANNIFTVAKRTVDGQVFNNLFFLALS